MNYQKHYGIRNGVYRWAALLQSFIFDKKEQIIVFEDAVKHIQVFVI